MTVKLVVLYAHPDDPAAFDQHFLGVHGPLVQAIPGLQRFETGRFEGALDRGEHSWYRIAELYFADRSTMDAGFASSFVNTGIGFGVVVMMPRSCAVGSRNPNMI